MRLQINKGEFLKNWLIAERNTSPKSTISSLTGVLIRAPAGEESATLEATDLKTSVKCVSSGVIIEKEGEAVLPVRLVGELFKKAPTNIFTLSIDEGRGVIHSGRNHYRFTTYPTKEFPSLPVSDDASRFCSIVAGDLLKILNEGTVACSATEEFPKYFGCVLFQLSGGEMKAVSTDGRRLSLSKCETTDNGPDGEFLLPLAGVREIQRLVASLDGQTPITIKAERTLVFFQMGGVELSVRRVDAHFPNYEAILSSEYTTTMEINRADLIAALERVDIIVRESENRNVAMCLSPGGDVLLQGSAPQAGAVEEILDASISGNALNITFNVAYLMDGIKAVNSDRASMNLNGPAEQMVILRPGGQDFLYMLMPVKTSETDRRFDEEEETAY
ncbi:MAG: DNA polymerase III subunit beta [Synergistaceae bacterium]|nr:DNA polymerase III subunit beta [Synergistaceae bacterium]